MPVYIWSQTAGANGSIDPRINFAEGQPPGSLNDSNRATMAELAKYNADIAGAIVTGGTSTAYTVASFSVYDTLAHLNGQMLAFSPHATNGAGAPSVTLNVDGLGAKPLRTSPGVDLASGVLIQGTPYVATYNNVDGAFYLQGFYSNPYNIPIGGGMIFTGTAAPNSSFVFPFGQAISRATYPIAFAIMGTTYGPGDGSTTFNLPDFRGRVVAGVDNMGGSNANRLTSGTGFGAAPVLGAVGGLENNSLNNSNLPPYTPSGTVTVTPVNGTNGIPLSVFSGGGTSGFSGAGANASGALFGGPTGETFSNSFLGNAQGGTSAVFRTVQPTILCNYILRIL